MTTYRKDEDTGEWGVTDRRRGGVGVGLSWEQLGALLQKEGTMMPDEYIIEARATEYGIQVSFERKPG